MKEWMNEIKATYLSRQQLYLIIFIYLSIIATFSTLQWREGINLNKFISVQFIKEYENICKRSTEMFIFFVRSVQKTCQECSVNQRGSSTIGCSGSPRQGICLSNVFWHRIAS